MLIAAGVSKYYGPPVIFVISCFIHPKPVLQNSFIEKVCNDIGPKFVSYHRNHRYEERWLRSAKVVYAVSIWYMTVCFNHILEVPCHVKCHIPVAVCNKPTSGEVAIPIVYFSKAATRYYIRMWQRDQRGMRRGVNICWPKQHWP